MNRPRPHQRSDRRPAPAPTGTTIYDPFVGQAPEVVAATLERILASKTFRRSARHRRFLRHVVGATLEGRHDALKEIVIGIEVFDRALPRYDPRQDPIVRVEAGRVRDKLARYYADEGLGDAFQMQIPVGGYLPQLSRRGATKAAARSMGSIAVLPFASLSSDAANTTFCAALADQIVDQLSRVPGLRVVGRLSAIKAREKSGDLKMVGKLLGVQHVVEGSVQRAGLRCRCIAQLCRTRDRACIWSQRFETDAGEAADPFAFQDRIADAVLAAVARIGVPAASDDGRPSATRPAIAVPAARDLYERARYLVRIRDNDDLAKGIALLERSIALDPGFAPAHSLLGSARSMFYGVMARPAVAAFREVEQHARRALELDPLDGDARALLGSIAFRVDRDWPRAEALFRDALQVAPNTTNAHLSYAAALVFNGRYLEALEHARIALDLDPLNISVRLNLAVITAYARDYRTAIDEFRSLLDIEPDHYFVHVMAGSTWLWAGDGPRAMTHFDAALRIAPAHPIAQFDRVFVHGLMGDLPGGRRLLTDLLARLAGHDYQRYNVAMAEAYLGDVDALCAALRLAADAHELLFTSVPADPSFDPYRDHPDFVALMAEYQLPRLPPSPFASSPRD